MFFVRDGGKPRVANRRSVRTAKALSRGEQRAKAEAEGIGESRRGRRRQFTQSEGLEPRCEQAKRENSKSAEPKRRESPDS